MTVKRSFCISSAAVLLLNVSPIYAAEQDTVQVIIPWEAEGRVFQVDPSTMMFVGAIRGVMYIKSSRGELHEAFVMCPLIQKLVPETGMTEAIAHCELTASSEDVAYAELSCAGDSGNCQGTFRLIGGEGRFAGVSGTGELRVRSPIRALIADMASGADVLISSGLAVVDDLNYQIP